MLLAAFRASARRCASVQCIVPRYCYAVAHPLSTAEVDRAEAMNALGIRQANPSEGDPSTVLPALPAPPTIDLSNMHHHIPPATSPLLQFMTTLLMKHGKYAKASKTISRMLLHIYSITRSPPFPIVHKAIHMASPVVRNRKMKHGGGKMVYVPQALNERQRARKGIKTIIDEVQKKGKPGKTYAERLARQIVAIVNGHEGVLKGKEEIHKLAMVNRGVLPKR